MILFSIALVICVGDSVGFFREFHLYNPQYFFQNYSNGTAFGPEWETQLVFPPWLRWLVVFSPLALVSVTIVTLYNLYVSHANTVGSLNDATMSNEDQILMRSNFFTMALLNMAGKRQSDKARMVRIMPVIYVFMSYNSIMRVMQLFTGAINVDLPRYESENLSEKMNFVDFMVIGNDNCMALTSAWALLNFAAYVLQGLESHDGEGSSVSSSSKDFSKEGLKCLRMLVKSVLFQMLKSYLLVNIVQTLFGVFSFFVFREQASDGHGLLSISHLHVVVGHMQRFGALVHGGIQGAGVIASMSTWGSLSILSHSIVSDGCADIDGEHMEVFSVKTSTGKEKDSKLVIYLFGLKSLAYNKKFLSIKIMVSLCFLQKMGIRAIASFVGYPKMTHYLIAEVILIYEVVMLSVFMKDAWPEDIQHSHEKAEPLLG